MAGHDTTTSLIGNGVVALLDHPDQLARLRTDPDLIPAAVEELLRFTAPVPHGTFRYATDDVELDGEMLRGGKQVLVCLAAANRDPEAFDQPERLDVDRHPKGHVAFGHGIHFCLGPHAHAFAVPRDQLHRDHGDGLVLRGLSALPLRVTLT